MSFIQHPEASFNSTLLEIQMRPSVPAITGTRMPSFINLRLGKPHKHDLSTRYVGKFIFYMELLFWVAMHVHTRNLQKMMHESAIAESYS